MLAGRSRPQQVIFIRPKPSLQQHIDYPVNDEYLPFCMETWGGEEF
jgi:hypothetical protein